ncbi:large-conductance mechanosensitive channel protein MscL [Stenotrophobium rhamnosiphilum]|uniref:Large-conductance mechanosensitive channel n=1 Tax=Stenotrophobium rhamnosiphilum TaxID=2029166 RepID=A0A2T5MFV0_9GAMM|nr:large-conductance mechanosensitive channel protein MscL [Stenotrophobium rhamnosiphilum]PTU31453.1 large conductance mechanosensitive channel protein MscL [Stenotrophobium rhamnosiphilum]
MSMMKEFKDFAMRGNVVDLAVGVVIGAAFGAIVTSLVGDVVMPVIGMATSGVDFSKSALVLQEASADGKTPAVLLSYGKFLQTMINFVIVAFVIFLVVKAMNSVKKKEAAAPAATPAQEVLLAEIRDLLKKK